MLSVSKFIADVCLCVSCTFCCELCDGKRVILWLLYTLRFLRMVFAYLYSPPVKQSVCTFVINVDSIYAEPSVVLDKDRIEVMTEATFFGVVSDRTVSYKNHINYLKTNRLKSICDKILKRQHKP